jgi:hypothetical protein
LATLQPPGIDPAKHCNILANSDFVATRKEDRSRRIPYSSILQKQSRQRSWRTYIQIEDPIPASKQFLILQQALMNTLIDLANGAMRDDPFCAGQVKAIERSDDGVILELKYAEIVGRSLNPCRQLAQIRAHTESPDQPALAQRSKGIMDGFGQLFGGCLMQQ